MSGRCGCCWCHFLQDWQHCCSSCCGYAWELAKLECAHRSEQAYIIGARAVCYPAELSLVRRNLLRCSSTKLIRIGLSGFIQKGGGVHPASSWYRRHLSKLIELGQTATYCPQRRNCSRRRSVPYVAVLILLKA